MINLAHKTPYLFQGDSSNPKQAWRMCFSSTCAMLAESINPGCLIHHPKRGKRQLDDFYRETLEANRFGDTTEYTAQLRTLAVFCPQWKFQFRQNLTWADVIESLERKVPVPMGILHHGPVSAPRGGGHWILGIGINDTHLVAHDPAGDLNVVDGGYLSSAPTAGREIKYTRANLGKRWMVKGNDGWGILATR